VSTDLRSGIEALKQGDAAAAVRHLEAAARAMPGSAAPLLYLGAAYGECQRTRDAIRALTLAARLEPANSRVHYNLGIALERADQPDEAAAALRIAVALEPDYVRAREALARVEAVEARATLALPRDPADRAAATARAAAELAAPPNTRLCPSCGRPMFVREEVGVDLDCCAGCGGVWFDHGELALVARAGRGPVDALRAAVGGSGPAIAGAAAEILFCPTCRSVLVTTEHGAMAGVRMEACHNGHGLWITAASLGPLARGLPEPAPPAPPAPPILAGPMKPVQSSPRRLEGAPRDAPERPAPERPAERGSARSADLLCASCGAANSAQARACWACGELLQQVGVDFCPYCQAALLPLEDVELNARACEGCGGIWLEPGALAALAATSADGRRQILDAARALRTGTILRLSPALLCGHCRLVMLGGPMHELTSHPVHACPRCSSYFIGQHVLEEIALGRAW